MSTTESAVGASTYLLQLSASLEVHQHIPTTGYKESRSLSVSSVLHASCTVHLLYFHLQQTASRTARHDYHRIRQTSYLTY